MTEREKLKYAVESLNIPILEAFTPLLYPSVYIDTYKQGAGLFGGGLEEESKEYLKIHIWSKGKEECETLKRNFRKMLKESGIYADIEGMHDPAASVFRYVFTVEILEEDEVK